MQILSAIDHFLRHMEHERHASEYTISGYRRDLSQFLIWLDRTLALEAAQGQRPPRTRPNDLAHFTPERIRAWQASLSIERRLHPNTVRRMLHAVSSFARWLTRTGAVSQNPMELVTLPKARKRAKVGLPLEVWHRVMALDLAPREATIRGVLAYAGLRRAEVLAMAPIDLRLGDRQPTLLVHGKGAKERVVPVVPPLRELLFDYTTRTGRFGRERLFQTDEHQPIHPSTLTAWVVAWGKRVQWPLHPHLFRDSYASGLLAAGVNIKRVQEWLGHESLATTEHYLHSLQTEPDRVALASWVGMLTPATITGPIPRQSTSETPEDPDTWEGMI